MNKTVNINLAGIFFHIDEDAYLKLQRYLEAIQHSFTDSQGRLEIIADIEARIAELFTERIQQQKQVVGLQFVDEVIGIMGQPEDYIVDNEIFEDAPDTTSSFKSLSSKRLYRDTDNSYIGGVASGLGHYFNVPTIWIRIIWLLLAIGSGGSFIVIYLIFWALVPEAKTTAEKLTMTGDVVNISNIEKKIKDGINTVSESVRQIDFKKHSENLRAGFDNVSDNISETVKNVDFEKQGSRLKTGSQSFFSAIRKIILFVLKLVAKIIGIVLILFGIGTLLSLVITLLTVGVTDFIEFPGLDFLKASNAANTPIWLLSLLLFFAIGIPFFFIFYLGLKILIKNLKSIGNVAKFTLLGLWVIAIIGLIISGIKQATEHAFDATITSKTQLHIATNDTLRLSMNNFDKNDVFYRSNNGQYNIYEDENGRVIESDRIRLIIRSTKDSLGALHIKKFATGSNYNIAKKRAENINYTYSFSNHQLKLNGVFTTDFNNKLSDQKLVILLYLPEGSVLYAKNITHNYDQNTKFYNDILDSGMEEHYLKIIENDVKCLDCVTTEKQRISENITPLTRELEDNAIPEINVKINEDGVDINLKEN